MNNENTPNTTPSVNSGTPDTGLTGGTEIPLNSAPVSSDVPPPVDPFMPQPPNDVPLSSSNPTVIVPGSGRIPAWFSVLFVITLLAFLGVSGLLVYTLSNKNTANKNQAVPTAAPTVTIRPTVIPSPVASQSGDLVPLTSGDSVSNIEEDIKNTDLTVIDKALSEIDKKNEVKPSP